MLTCAIIGVGILGLSGWYLWISKKHNKEAKIYYESLEMNELDVNIENNSIEYGEDEQK